MSPRYAGSVTPSRVSVSLERGLANCPAIRPIFTTGMDAPYVSTTAICSTVFTRLRIRSAVAPANVSAQSPPWSRNARPAEAAANRSRSMSTSPANTSGGGVASSSEAAPPPPPPRESRGGEFCQFVRSRPRRRRIEPEGLLLHGKLPPVVQSGQYRRFGSDTGFGRLSHGASSRVNAGAQCAHSRAEQNDRRSPRRTRAYRAVAAADRARCSLTELA